ncbi:SLC13 family permease [Aliiruegeria lutimaris]|uniref:TrkA-C domain-containing protein n=1 Tax=Aliiruegeria lutimaris TaxID=571298 RepID=A0A1G8PN61_9RHOB|nr:SLC13 family permease [Aliiruegeria lutimaris]SDI93934.1 TrkA-C domain-containing protein [Aliiruegeria lutimaris]
MEQISLTYEMVMVLCVLGLTVGLFVTELVRVDVAALAIMVMLGCLASLPGLDHIVDIQHLFSGFSSNAVISIIAVMIIGAGLDRTGVMTSVANWITRIGGSAESRIVLLISSTVAFISSFMQNVGAAALFLPVVSRIAARTGLPMSRLLMPMGFCAILGGTLTMVGSSPLILLNDLFDTINPTLPPDQQMADYSLFSVAPIGLALVAAGLAYFIFFGRFVLPEQTHRAAGEGARGQSLLEYVSKTYGIDGAIHEIIVPPGSILVGQSIDDIQRALRLQIIATQYEGKTYTSPPRDTVLQAPARLAIIAEPGAVEEFKYCFELEESPVLAGFAEDLGPTRAGIAEVVIPPGSGVIGKSARDLWLRKAHGLAPLLMYRGGKTYSRETADIDFGEIPFEAGDTLVGHITWEALTRMEQDRDFVVVTQDYPRETTRPQKVGWALIFFLIAISLVLLTDMRLSLCLLVGALGMILSNVLSIDEAYESVSWSTVFLLASLIPLGQAVQSTGTAEWIAHQLLTVLDGMPIWVIQATVAVLATVFSLIMSNVGATVLLVPLAVNIALGAGADPAVFALTVAISTSNSFLIPTHQVNALLMGPGGYSVRDFIRAGGIMTAIFLVVSVLVMNLFY